MVGFKGSIRIALVGVSGILALFPLLSGQGCGVQPLNLGLGGNNKSATDAGNYSPYMEFTSPTIDISREIGDVVRITWMISDPDSNCAIELQVDPDEILGNGNEKTLGPLIMQNSGQTSFDLDTREQGLADGTYRILARVNDGANAEVLSVAPGKLLLYKAGLLPGNKAPRIAVSAPVNNLGVSQGDHVSIQYCGSDADKGRDGIIPDIIVLLDEDNDPNNDLNLRDANAEATLADLLQGGLPRKINGAIVIGLFKSTDCGLTQVDATGAPVLDPVTGAPVKNPLDPPLDLVIDVGQIPPLPGGSPYRVRADIWDHISRPVNSYAPGSVSVTSLGSGIIDLAQVGRSISGTKFMGFDAGAMAGSAATDLGDFDGDGADDFVIISRFGNPNNIGNIGGSHLVCGMKGQKFASEVSLNSVGTTLRGTQIPLHSGHRTGCINSDFPEAGTQGTAGIVSVARVADVNGDGRPEIIYGMPWIRNFKDHVSDDPCGCGCPNGACYGDYLPNPWSATGSCGVLDGCGQRYMGDRDWREHGFCSNDGLLESEPYLEGGYAVLVGSEAPPAPGLLDPFLGDLANHSVPIVRGLNLMGQDTDGGGPQFPGARFRGSWYDEFDFSMTGNSNALVMNNSFGQTVRSMPSMRNTDWAVSPRFGDTLLISSPNAYKNCGVVNYIPAEMDNGSRLDWTNWVGGSRSFPSFSCTNSCPGPSRGIAYPGFAQLKGVSPGDEFGYADSAGDYNLDGSRDIVCGAPGATRNGLTNCGIVYVIFGRPDFAELSGSMGGGGQLIDLASSKNMYMPRIEIRGTNPYDRFGAMQTIVGDVNQDGLPDVGFSSQYADGPGGVDCGFVGILFGGVRITGEKSFDVTQVGTSQLPGVKLFGSQPGGNAGAMIANAGDFNGDGIDDLLISAPNETRMAKGQIRKGVAYIVFGGPHLYNATLSLAQVGTPELPGVVFVSPYTLDADEAPIDMVSAAGDVNGDGFADVLIGVSKADYVNPLEPNQRREAAGEAYLIYGSNTGSNGM